MKLRDRSRQTKRKLIHFYIKGKGKKVKEQAKEIIKEKGMVSIAESKRSTGCSRKVEQRDRRKD